MKPSLSSVEQNRLPYRIKERLLKKWIAKETKTIPGQLDDFLIAYDSRLIDIDQKYPLGNRERQEWIETHRANGLRRILEIVRWTLIK
jgi:hypothetical protein